jgi:hypothetical protein
MKIKRRIQTIELQLNKGCTATMSCRIDGKNANSCIASASMNTQQANAPQPQRTNPTRTGSNPAARGDLDQQLTNPA